MARLCADGAGTRRQLVVRNLRTGQEFRHPRGTNPAFTPDGKFVDVHHRADQGGGGKGAPGESRRGGENAGGRGAERSGRGAANTPPRTSGGIMTLATGQVSDDRARQRRQMPEESSTWVAMHRGRAGAGGGRGGRGGRGLDVARRRAGGSAGRASGRRARVRADGANRAPSARTPAAISIVRNLTTGQEITIPLVSDFAWSKDGSWLAYAVSSTKAEEDGAFARKMSDGTVARCTNGKGNYKGSPSTTRVSSWRSSAIRRSTTRTCRRIACTTGRPVTRPRPSSVSAATRGVPQGLVVSDQFAPRFSDDGQRLYLGTAPPPAPPAAEGAPAPTRRGHLELAGPAASADAARARAAGTQPHLPRRRAPRRQALRAAGDR